MSSFIKDWYYCIDNYFWPHIYWFVKMTPEEEQASIIDKWNLLDFKTLEWRWWTRPVLKEMPKFSNIPVSIARNNPMTRHTDSLHLWSAPDKLVKLSDVEAMINKELHEKIYIRNQVGASEYELWQEDMLEQLLSSLSSLPTQNVPEIDNFYEFSEGWEVWIKWRFARYTYRSDNWWLLSARYIRNLPPTN